MARPRGAPLAVSRSREDVGGLAEQPITFVLLDCHRLFFHLATNTVVYRREMVNKGNAHTMAIIACMRRLLDRIVR